MATPLTPSKFVEILRAEGLTVATPYGGWTTHGRDEATGKAFGPVHGVVIHHTAGTDSLRVVYNGTSSLPGPLCHGHLPKAGTVNMISAHRANHAGSFAQNAYDAMLNESSVHPYPDSSEPVDANDSTYGLEIENLGTGADRYPWKQYVAAVKWATAICRYYGWSQDSVIGHKEGTRRKVDPKGPVQGPDGTSTFEFTMNRFRADVKAALALPAGEWAKTSEGEEVAITNDDIKKIFLTDGLFKAGDPVPGNTYWPVMGYLEETYKRARDAREAALNGLADIADVKADLEAVKAKLDALAVGGVDLDVLAVKVADEIYRRMAS